MGGEIVTLNPKKSPLVFSLLCAWLALLGASFLYEWDVPIVYPTRGPAEAFWREPLFPETEPTGTMWAAAAESCRLLGRHEMSFPEWRRQQQGNLTRVLLVLLAGAVLGRLVYWIQFGS